MAQRFYSIEYRDERGQIGVKPESQGMTRQRAFEKARRFVLENPAKMCFVYLEVHKDAGLHKKGPWRGMRTTAAWTETVGKFVGPSYRGPSSVRSTMMMKGRGHSIPELVRPQADRRSWAGAPA